MPFIMEGVGDVTALMVEMGARMDAACGEWVAASAAVVEREMKLNSIVDTGQLRRSVTSDPVVGGGGSPWMTMIYPSVIYGRRVELGFTGTDSLGRYYDQAGRPRFGPALDSVRMELAALFITLASEAIGA